MEKGMEKKEKIKYTTNTPTCSAFLYLSCLSHPAYSHMMSNFVAEEMNEWSRSINTAPQGPESGGHLNYYQQIKYEPAPEPYLDAVYQPPKDHYLTKMWRRNTTPKTPYCNKDCVKYVSRELAMNAAFSTSVPP